jgi:DNA repair exonuclease SbcCD ATPase subunit
MQQLRGINPTDPNYIGLAQKQKDVKDNLKTAEDSLYSLSQRIPQIQSPVNKEITAINAQIDQALDNLGERKTPEAMRNQQFAMTSMNNLALMLSEALDQLQKQQNKAGKGKGKQQSLSQLSKMQQQLNQNMQKARDQMQKTGNPQQGKTGQQGMSEQFARMAREQQMIRQSLQQISKESNKDGTNGLGDLDKISKEMEQTENDLVNKKITNEALKRQQQIQTRLLEAEKVCQPHTFNYSSLFA